MPLVAIQPSSGLGNQLFMMAAALGYAELHGLIPVFWEEPTSSWEHQGSLFRVREMFPHIRVLTEEERTGLPWVSMNQPFELTFTYVPMPTPPPNVNVRLGGYFQTDLYGPSTFPTVPPPKSPLHSALIAHDWTRTFFLHVRRGDYQHPANAHHAVDFSDYWRTCLAQITAVATAAVKATTTNSITCFVVSDDIAWCKENLGPFVGNTNVLWCPPELSDVETFFWMTACDLGGICANSTFSWWAAWYGRRRVGNKGRYYMPKCWGYAPLPPSRDLHPAWAIVI